MQAMGQRRPARVSSGVRVDVEELGQDDVEPRLFLELSSRGGRHALAGLDETAG